MYFSFIFGWYSNQLGHLLIKNRDGGVLFNRKIPEVIKMPSYNKEDLETKMIRFLVVVVYKKCLKKL